MYRGRLVLLAGMIALCGGAMLGLSVDELLCNCAGSGPWVLAIGGAVFGVAGATALVELVREQLAGGREGERHGRRANVILFSVGMAILAVATGLAALAALDHRRPAPRVRTDVEAVFHEQHRKTRYVSVGVLGAPGLYTWSCRGRRCEDYAALLTLEVGELGRTEIQAIGSRLVGLKSNGKVYLDPARERARLIREDLGFAAGCGAVLVLMVLIAIHWLRNRPKSYGRLDPISAARVRDLMRRSLPPLPPTERR